MKEFDKDLENQESLGNQIAKIFQLEIVERYPGANRYKTIYGIKTAIGIFSIFQDMAKSIKELNKIIN